jgi:hypothetical protein
MGDNPFRDPRIAELYHDARRALLNAESELGCLIAIRDGTKALYPQGDAGREAISLLVKYAVENGFGVSEAAAEAAVEKGIEAATTKPRPTPLDTSRPTADATVEAMMYSLRSRGLACLEDAGNRDRLRRCDQTAIMELAKRLKERGSWPDNQIETLVLAWRDLR